MNFIVHQEYSFIVIACLYWIYIEAISEVHYPKQKPKQSCRFYQDPQTLQLDTYGQ